MTSPRAMRGLDWLYFFVADLQTGFGPFIAVYLTHHQWTQGELGIALGVGSMTSILAQVPGGLVVDALRDKRMAAGLALAVVCLSAVLLALSPDFWPVLLAQALHGFASCMLNPALAAVTLGLVSSHLLAERLGRNARFAAIGSAVGAVLMGACGTYLSVQAVFWLAAFFCIPAMLALHSLGRSDGGADPTPVAQVIVREPILPLLLDRRLLAYIGCAFLFHLSNAAMLPLAAVEITKRADEDASLIIAACILVPQLIVALLSPSAGALAQRRGRRLVLIIGFCALPARALLLSIVDNPYLVVAVQALDGLGAAAFGVITPLVAADISGPGGRFNLRIGVLGLAIGVAATLSNVCAGFIAEELGNTTAFTALALVGAGAVMMVALGMPETRPTTDADAQSEPARG